MKGIYLKHVDSDRRNHKYIAKVKMSNGKNKYFYTKEEYNAYVKNKTKPYNTKSYTAFKNGKQYITDRWNKFMSKPLIKSKSASVSPSGNMTSFDSESESIRSYLHHFKKSKKFITDKRTHVVHINDKTVESYDYETTSDAHGHREIKYYNRKSKPRYRLK